MAEQYLRSYEFTVVDADGNETSFSDLRIMFEITKSTLSYPNLAMITVFNTNPDTSSSLEEKYSKIKLKAGYGGNNSLIFSGEIRNVLAGKTNVDRSVIIYAGDGEKDWQNSYYNKTFSESIAMDTIITDIVDSFEGLAKGIIEGLPTIADKLSGQTLSGKTSEILDTLLSEYGLNWSIQDGEINIVDENESLEALESVLVSASTGMIGSPTVTEIGVNVTTLLNPLMLPGKKITIDSKGADASLGNLFFIEGVSTKANGDYKIQEVIFKGDTHDGQWISSAVCESL